MSQQLSHTKRLPLGPGATDRLLTFTSNTSLSQLPQPPQDSTRVADNQVSIQSVCLLDGWRNERPRRLQPGDSKSAIRRMLIKPASIKVLDLQGGWKVHAPWKDTGGQPGYERSLQPSSHLTFSFSCWEGKAPRWEECRTAWQVIRAESCWETNKADTKQTKQQKKWGTVSTKTPPKKIQHDEDEALSASVVLNPISPW